MKKLVIIMIAVSVISVALAATNPAQPEFKVWAKAQAVRMATTGLEKGLTNLFGDMVIDTNTSRYDYFLFSIYKTSSLDGKRHEIIGIMNHFIPYK